MSRLKEITVYRAAEQSVEEASMPAMDARQVCQRHSTEWFAKRADAEKALEARLLARTAERKSRARGGR